MTRRKPPPQDADWRPLSQEDEWRPGFMRVPWPSAAAWKRKTRKEQDAALAKWLGLRPKRRSDGKFDVALNILVKLNPGPGLLPAEIQKKVLAKLPPELRRRWRKLGPDDRLKPPISRRQIYRAYLAYLAARSSK